MTDYITSDLHMYHKKILQFCPETRPYESLEHMHEIFIWSIQRVLEDPENHLYILGDFSFKGKERTEEILQQLPCDQITLVLGNHDKHHRKLYEQYFKRVVDYLEVNVRYDWMSEKLKVCMFHFPIEQGQWNSASYGSLMLHGHCVDGETEILTMDGFKKRCELSENDIVGTMNTETMTFEWSSIMGIHDVNYTGDVFSVDERNVNMRVTKGHRIPFHSYSGNYDVKLVEFLATGTETPVNIYTSTIPDYRKGLDLSDDLIRLYVILACDGNLTGNGKDLCRVSVKKEHKKVFIRGVLSSLSLGFKELPQKDGETLTFHFYLPKELKGLKIKGMDCALMGANSEQFDVIVHAISQTDGNRNSGGVMYYTSKKREVDIIQSCAIRNGYTCNVNTRIGHGFSSGESYAVYLKKMKHPRKNFRCKDISVSQTENENFWCVTVNNGNFFCRREGKVHLTGNCHGQFKTGSRRRDVGIDGQGRFYTLEEVVADCLKDDIIKTHHVD